MGTLDRISGCNTKRKIKLIDITEYTITQFENNYNSNYGDKGWRIIQIITLNDKNYVLAEKEVF